MKKTEASDYLQMFAEEASAEESNGAGEDNETGAEENPVSEETVGEAESTEPSEQEKKTEETTAVSGKEAAEERLRDSRNTLRAVGASFAEMKRARAVKEIHEKWEKDSEVLKDTYPDFELKKALKNPEFTRLLRAGVSVRRAWEAVNLDSIVSTAMRYALVTSGRRTAEAITRQNSRPQETGVLDSATSVRRTDVNSLTEKDIMAILDKVGKGAKITF